jgi:hypothetical protein
MRNAARICVAFVALASAVVVAGCGGAVTALDPVAQAATKSSADQSFRFTLRSDRGLTGDGAYDADAKRLRMSLSVPVGTGSPTPLELVTDGASGLVLYVRVPFLAALLPQGKSWVEVDVERAAHAQGLDLGQLLQTGRSSPAQLLAALAHSKDSQKLGTETVDGVRTTHYRATIDPRDALTDGVPAKTRKQLEQALGKTDLAPVPVDVWVGDDGLVRRLRVELPQLAGADGGTFTEELTGYGEPVTVELPPAATVVDASSGKLYP